MTDLKGFRPVTHDSHERDVRNIAYGLAAVFCGLFVGLMLFVLFGPPSRDQRCRDAGFVAALETASGGFVCIGASGQVGKP